MVAALCAWAATSKVVPEPTGAVARTLVSPAPFTPLAGWAILSAGAVAPHRAFVKLGRNVVLRLARIPKMRRLLQRKWPIWGKLLLKNKMRAEVTSYRLAMNEAWDVLEGTLPQDTLQAMREAEANIAGYAVGAGDATEGGDEPPPRASRLAGWRRGSKAGLPPGQGQPSGKTNEGRRGGEGSGEGGSTGGGGWIARGRRDRQRQGSFVDGGGLGVTSQSDAATGRGSPGVGQGAGAGHGQGNGAAQGGGNAAQGHNNQVLGFMGKLGAFSRVASHKLFIGAPSSVYGILTARESGAELLIPRVGELDQLAASLTADARLHFTRAQHAAFLLQYNRDVGRAAAAMERSLQWRRRYRFLPSGDLRRFEKVVFVHGKRHAYTGGVHLVFRLSAVSAAERAEGLDAVAAAIVSHVEAQWAQLGIQGDAPGRLRGRLIALVDCAGVTPGSFPASLVAHTLVTLDSNYPELAAEVHVVNVWWLVKRGLTALLEATSASTRRRVRIYRNDETGAEKLGIRFAPHALPACFPGGRCACATCKKLLAAGGVGSRHGSSHGLVISGEEFAHGGLTGRHQRWGTMSSAQKRQYLRHLFFYYLGLAVFWPMHIFRLNLHPLLVTIMRAQKLTHGFFVRLKRGDPVVVFAVTVVFFTWMAFAAAVLAWWAEYGSTLLLQSMRHPPTTWGEAWQMSGLFQRSISSSLERSLGLEAGTLPGGGFGLEDSDMAQLEDGGWVMHQPTPMPPAVPAVESSTSSFFSFPKTLASDKQEL